MNKQEFIDTACCIMIAAICMMVVFIAYIPDGMWNPVAIIAIFASSLTIAYLLTYARFCYGDF